MATLFVGIDVAKDSLVIAVRPLDRRWECPNTPQGCRQLVQTLTALAESPAQIRVVLESTGGLELDAAIALQEAGLEVAVIKPERARYYAKATGQLAKTDAIDARLLAEFAEKVDVTIYPLPSAAIRDFRDLLDRREQLVEMKVMESNRLASTTDQQAVASVSGHVKWLEREIGKVEKTMKQRIAGNEQWRELDRILQTIPGIGNQVSRTLIGQLPELGYLDRKAISHLAGLAPMAHDSGTQQGTRHIVGGRQQVRNMLYMAAVVASHHNEVCAALYQRLLARGKATKVALIAVAHKLLVIANAMVRNKTEWRPSRVAENA
jgi:transposase